MALVKDFRVGKGADRGLHKKDMKDQVPGRIRGTADMVSFSGCDLVIEAVFEDERVKAEVLSSLDRLCKPRVHRRHEHLDDSNRRSR